MGLGVAITSSAQAQTFISLCKVIEAGSASRKSCSGAAAKPAYSDPIKGEVPGSGPDTQNRVALLTTRGQEAAPRVDETVLCKLYGLTARRGRAGSKSLAGKINRRSRGGTRHQSSHRAHSSETYFNEDGHVPSG